jgi:hypothetical protein
MFSPGTPASSITKAGRHDIAEILLEVALRTINQIESINHCIALHIIQKRQHHQRMNIVTVTSCKSLNNEKIYLFLSLFLTAILFYVNPK